VLEQHRYAAQTARGERVGKGAAHHHVARLVNFAEETGITFDGAVGIDCGARREYGRTVGSDKGASITGFPVVPAKRPRTWSAGARAGTQ
jgi:hypothetical protein